ncbi:MAG TPA: bifunctional oligoribonuclease/PAP phosphatase NrnA, partial [Nitrospiria bacterium]|nr:bifunctional oligoribonuclease/PAP phosphatase NrnA [Nitrospiria bacterium]
MGEKLNKVIETIQKNRSFVVTTHCNPEGDALGSSLALALFLRQIGKEARVVTKDPTPYFLQFLPEKELISRSPDLGSGFDVLCVCDC